MTQPAHIPGLITSAGVAPNQPPAGQPVPAAQPGTTVPGPQQPEAVAPPAQAAPIPVTPAVQAVPVDPATGWALPTTLGQPPAAAAAAQVPGLNAVTVPGLNPPAAVVPQQPPAQPAPAQQPATGGEQDRGYPEGTPLEQMTGEQREAYYKFHMRKWEGRAKERSDYDTVKAKADQYDQFVASQATEQEKAVTAARAEGERTATARAAVVLVDAHVRAGLQTRLQPHQVEALASNLNHQHFLGADGLSVDAAKVSAFVDTVAPGTAAFAATAPAVPVAPGALPVGVPASAPPQQPVTGLPRALPDLGQGTQTSAPLDKLEAGRQQARAFLQGNGYR